MLSPITDVLVRPERSSTISCLFLNISNSVLYFIPFSKQNLMQIAETRRCGYKNTQLLHMQKYVRNLYINKIKKSFDIQIY